METELTNRISSEIGKQYKEIAGRGPQKIKSFIMEDMVIIRYSTYTVPFIETLKSTDEKIVERIRQSLFKNLEIKLSDFLSRLLNKPVKESFFNQNIDSKEACIVVIFKEKIIV